MSKFNVGDKVRYSFNHPTRPDWTGSTGTVIKTYDGFKIGVSFDKGTTLREWFDLNTWHDGWISTERFELVEAAPPVWKVGDLVEFWDEGNDHWQGGKGKVTANPSVTYNREGFVDVEILEEMPLNTIQKVGKVVAVPEKDLRAHLEEWEQELLGLDVAPKPYEEEEEEAEEEPVKTCSLGFSWCDCALEEKEAKEEVVEETPKEAVKHPAHYGGDTTYETWKVAEAWGLDEDAYLFNVLKYISRAGKKEDLQEDLEKAEAYLKRRIEHPLGAAK